MEDKGGLEEPIDVDAIKVQTVETKWWTSSLTENDREVLVTGGWLSDVLVNAAQTSIQAVHPSVSGFQDVSLGLTMAFSVMRKEFVQVLHTGGGHWLTISTLGCAAGEVDVFDSSSPHLSTSLKNQIAALLCTDQPAIQVRYVTISILLCS